MSFIGLRNADPERIVSEALGLNDLQQEIYFGLRDTEKTVKDLVERTGRTRSVVQRALQDMLEKGIIAREGKTEKTVYYVYTAVPFEKVQEKVSDILADWHTEVQDRLQ